MARFFSGSKRGELHELKEELHSTDRSVCKDAVKKVIASMTVGKDVSSLFPDVVQCMQSSNIELKKLVYLYVLNYAKAQPELAILAVNTFRKDASDPNPLIRALAVRTMGCIKLDEVMEYLLDPLKRSCNDPDPYVRKTAAICISKIHEINPEACADQGFLEILKDMTGDSNPMVVANAVTSLLEIQESAARTDLLILDDSTVSRLLNALNECTEWGQVAILEAFSSLSAKRLTEFDTLVERVVPRLNHNNPAVVMGSVKVIIRFIDRVRKDDLVRALQKKLVPPLVSLMATEPATQYVALRNINLLIQQRPHLLASEIRTFFCKYTDPIYVKLEKLEILIMLVAENNVAAVLMEFKDYATEIDVDFVRKAIRGIGRIAVKLDSATPKCIAVLLHLVETKVNYVVQEAVIVIKDIFRKYPLEYERVISALCENIESLDQPEAKAAFIWILGEHAERIENCDEILSTFTEYFAYEPSMVQLQILTAAVKLFLKVPSIGQSIVSKVLKLATEESDSPDLRDRAFIYWRLLSTDPEKTKQVVLGDKPQIRFESTLLEMELLEKLVPQISLVSSVYHRLPHTFLTRGHPDVAVHEEEDETEQERAKRLEQLKKQTNLAERGELKGSGRIQSMDEDLIGLDTSPMHSKDSSVASLDILSLGNTSAPFDPLAGLLDSPSSTVVLARTQPGTGKQTGLEVSGSLSKNMKLHLVLRNFSSQPLSGFAIQFNKNLFGFAPVGQLNVPVILPGGSEETVVDMVPNQLLSDKPGPLVLQVALKCSLDVFYFTVPFELSVALVNGRIDSADWSSLPGSLGCEIHSTRVWNSETLNSALTSLGFHASGIVGNVANFSGKFVSGSAVLVQIKVKDRSEFFCEARCDRAELIGLIETMVSKCLM